MHPHKWLTSIDFDKMEGMYQIQFEDELLGHDWLELNATEILNADISGPMLKMVFC